MTHKIFHTLALTLPTDNWDLAVDVAVASKPIIQKAAAELSAALGVHVEVETKRKAVHGPRKAKGTASVSA